VTRYYEWRPLRPELGSYYSNHWFLEWISAKTGSAYRLHLLTAPRDSDVWIYSKRDLDIYLTWGAEQLDGEDCHFVSPSLSHWRALIDRISEAESEPMAALRQIQTSNSVASIRGERKSMTLKRRSWNGETFILKIARFRVLLGNESVSC
jgi:hypothetical protein